MTKISRYVIIFVVLALAFGLTLPVSAEDKKQPETEAASNTTPTPIPTPDEEKGNNGKGKGNSGNKPTIIVTDTSYPGPEAGITVYEETRYMEHSVTTGNVTHLTFHHKWSFTYINEEGEIIYHSQGKSNESLAQLDGQLLRVTYVYMSSYEEGDTSVAFKSTWKVPGTNHYWYNKHKVY